MTGFRFIHAADLHLDSPFAGLSGVPAGIRETLRQSAFTSLQGLVELAVRVKADFVLIAGDVYDSADRSLRAQVRFQKAMNTLAERGISAFVVHGNHDPADGKAAVLDWPEPVHIFGPDRVERIPVMLPGRGHVADVSGISYPTSAVRDNYALQFKRGGASVYQIGLLHANVDGSAEHEDYAPCSLQDLTGSGLDYWALGHVHSRRVLHESPYVVYPGNIQGRSIRETGPKGCYVVDVDEGGGTSLTFHSLDAVRWTMRCVSIAGLGSEQELKDRLELVLEETRSSSNGRPSVLRLELEGRGPLHRQLQGGYLQELVEELRLGEAERVPAESGTGDGAGNGAVPGAWSSEGFPAKGPVSSTIPAIDDFGPTGIGDSIGLEGDFVWIESVKDHTGPDVDRDMLAASPGFLGDVLRLSEGLLADRLELSRFAQECLEPLLANPKAGALARKSGLAGADGWDSESAAEWLRRASEWLTDRLADGEEEGA